MGASGESRSCFTALFGVTVLEATVFALPWLSTLPMKGLKSLQLRQLEDILIGPDYPCGVSDGGTGPKFPKNSRKGWQVSSLNTEPTLFRMDGRLQILKQQNSSKTNKTVFHPHIQETHNTFHWCQQAMFWLITWRMKSLKIEEFSTSVATYGRGLDVANLLPKELAHPCTKEFLKIHGNLQKSIINDDSKIYIQ